ncbi:hypothetical protein, conserved [Eimeria tenella]|uniref:Uncharacterized protein n=1 Tax=Eimeria tenella TaxID=5802 RepID=U6KX39_EIMTE|nr:hypothetical protein, conserved [Eimeria tenella]CDJ41488.1 hypothetical protein, conserved [Eimeria tenella]|eukprot:XP_013232238.1 hypothetical protein, conserved [Eimeria tenella]
MRTSRHKLHLLLHLARQQKRKLQSKSSNGGERGSNSKCAVPGTPHLPTVALIGNCGDCFLDSNCSVSSSNKHSNPCSKQDSIRPLRHTLVAPREQQQQLLQQLSTKRKKLQHRKWIKGRHFVLGRCGHHRLLQARRLASLQLLWSTSNEQQQRHSNSKKHGSSNYTNETFRENNGNGQIKRRRNSSNNSDNSCSRRNFSNGVSNNSGNTNSRTVTVEKANSSPVLEPAPKCAFTNIEFETRASQALQRLPDQEKYQEHVQQHQVNQRNVQQQQERHMQEHQCRQQQEREEICKVKPFIEGVSGGFGLSSTSGSRRHQQKQQQQDQQQKKQVEQLLNPLIDPLEETGSSADDSSGTGELYNYQQDQQLLLQQTPVCLQRRHTEKSSVHRFQQQQQQQQQVSELAADPEEVRRRQQRLQRDWGKEPIFCRIPSQSKHRPTLRELKDRLERLVQQQRQHNELQRQMQCHQGEKQQQQKAQEEGDVNDSDPQLCSAQMLQQQAGSCCFGGNEHGSSQLLAGQLLLRQRRQQQEAWRLLWRDFAQEEFRALRQYCIAQRQSVLKAALTVPAATAGAAESAARGDCPTEVSPTALEAEGAADAVAATVAAAASTPAAGVDSAAALKARAAPAEGDAVAVDSTKCQQLDVDGFLLQLLLRNLAAAAAAADTAESAVCCAALERLLLRKCVARATSGASADTPAAASTGFHTLLHQGLAFRLLLTTAAGAAALSTASSSMGSSLTLVTRIENQQQQQPQPHQCQQQQQSVASWARRLATSLRLRNFNRAFKLLQLLQQQTSREHCSVTSCNGNTCHMCWSSSEGLEKEPPVGSCSVQGQQQAEEQHLQQQKHYGRRQPQQHGAQQQQHKSILIDLFLALLPLLRSAFVELLLQAGPQKHREVAAAAAAAAAAAGNISTAAQDIIPHMVNPLHGELLPKQHQQQLLLQQQERSKADAVLKSLPLSVRRQLLLL